ncbi:MAG: sigma-70 family RNA polymerase sigma factor [Chitinophagales bacterium]|nr:sigma-70 family RNA polymerase sigma factor [Chitinophagales bacterium]MDW8428678.1 sigma-70 family RNA polymerase sigma factor [Chitinophagales bacterium]
MSEEELIHRLYQRDEEALKYLYDHYSAALFGMLLRIVKDEELAQELLQESFLRIWNQFDQYDKTKGRLFTWMIHLTRNLAIDATRSRAYRNRQHNLPWDNVMSFVERYCRHQPNPDQIGLRELVNQLEEPYRQIVDLAYFGGYTQAQIAERLNLPLGTVKTRLRTAIMKLRAFFK